MFPSREEMSAHLSFIRVGSVTIFTTVLDLVLVLMLVAVIWGSGLWSTVEVPVLASNASYRAVLDLGAAGSEEVIPSLLPSVLLAGHSVVVASKVVLALFSHIILDRAVGFGSVIYKLISTIVLWASQPWLPALVSLLSLLLELILLLRRSLR